jgi:hypothetical protein
MAFQIDKNKLFKDLNSYIKISSKRASDFFKMIDYKHEFFEGAIMDVSPETCEIMYIELLSNLIEKEAFIGQKHGLLAALIPRDATMVNVELGVVFPDTKS